MRTRRNIIKSICSIPVLLGTRLFGRENLTTIGAIGPSQVKDDGMCALPSSPSPQFFARAQARLLLGSEKIVDIETLTAYLSDAFVRGWDERSEAFIRFSADAIRNAAVLYEENRLNQIDRAGSASFESARKIRSLHEQCKILERSSALHQEMAKMAFPTTEEYMKAMQVALAKCDFTEEF